MKNYPELSFINNVDIEYKICIKYFSTFAIQHRGPTDVAKHTKIRKKLLKKHQYLFKNNT